MMVLEHISSAVTQLGEQMEMPNLQLDDKGALNLMLEDGDVLGIEAQDRGVLVSVAIILQEYDLSNAIEMGFMEVFLALQRSDMQLNIGLKEPQEVTQPMALFVTSNLQNSQVGVDSIMETFETLWEIRLRIKQMD